MPGKGWSKKDPPDTLNSTIKDIIKTKEPKSRNVQRKVGRPKKTETAISFISNLMNKTSEEKEEILVNNILDSINYAILGLPVGEMEPLESKEWVNLVKIMVETGIVKFPSKLGIAKNKKEETVPMNDELLTLLGVN